MFNKRILFIACFLYGCLAADAQDVHFSGTAKKKFDGDKIVIYNGTGLHDSAEIKNGKFSFTVPFKEPSLYMFFSMAEMKAKGGYSPYAVMVTKPGTIRMKADVEDFAKTRVRGSAENDIYRKFSAKGRKAQQEIMDQLYEKYGKDFVNNRNPDTSDAKYKELLKDYYQLSDANAKIQEEDLKTFIKEHPETFSAIFLLSGYATRMDLPEVESLYASLPDTYKDTRTGKSVASVIEARKITAIGKIAPDFTQADTSGNAVKLSDFRGKYVLVDFWASWCGPCRAENPNLLKTYAKFKDKNFTVLGVSLDQPGKKDAWLAAIHKDGLQWTQVSDLKFWDNDAAVLYGVKAIPSNFLLDPTGKIVAKDLRGEDLEKKLSELLGG